MKTLISRILNYLLYLSFCLMSGTGLMLAFRLPHGPGQRRRLIMGFTRHEWGDIHLYISYLFIALILLHLLIHRQWLRKIAAKSGIWQLIVGLILGLALILALLCAPLSS